MKFINYLESISGIEVFPMISLLIFFSFFILLAIKVTIMDKKYINDMVKLPLDGNDVKLNKDSKSDKL